MKIIIPMSGFGERFRRAGYSVPKPLIEIEGKPIIAHVLEMFPGETDVLFICNEEHLAHDQYRLRETLYNLCPTGEIRAIKPHRLGPVYAVAQVFDAIDLTKPTIVNYCDFTCYWDYTHFKHWVEQLGCEGCIPAYRGFHPHSLGTTNYAYTREENGRILDIQEKEPFTDNRMNEYASSGTYYFANGRLLMRYFKEALKHKLTVNNEYYVSLVYKPMIEQGLNIAVYELQHFMQWGTPEDVQEYNYWSRLFQRISTRQHQDSIREGAVMIPMVGAGRRFADENYSRPKPLIEVSGRPMFIQATRDLPEMSKQIFVVRQDLPQVETIKDTIQKAYPDAEIVELSAMTEGQAHTCLLAVEKLALDKPLVIGACDNGAIYDREHYERLMSDSDVDIIVWVMRGHPGAIRAPKMYGWVQCEGDRVVSVSVKTPLANPISDPAITGIFTFKRADYFVRAAKQLMQKDIRVNREFYVDSCINEAISLGLTCQIFEIDQYLGWGTPNDYRTFEYWQSCFHKWETHPYSLEQDPYIPISLRREIQERYRKVVPMQIRPSKCEITNHE